MQEGKKYGEAHIAGTTAANGFATIPQQDELELDPEAAFFHYCMNNTVYGSLEGAKNSYGFATRNGGKASDCIGCGQCESVCPQHIDIIEQLKKAAATLED